MNYVSNFQKNSFDLIQKAAYGAAVTAGLGGVYLASQLETPVFKGTNDFAPYALTAIVAGTILDIGVKIARRMNGEPADLSNQKSTLGNFAWSSIPYVGAIGGLVGGFTGKLLRDEGKALEAASMIKTLPLEALKNRELVEKAVETGKKLAQQTVETGAKSWLENLADRLSIGVLESKNSNLCKCAYAIQGAVGNGIHQLGHEAKRVGREAVLLCPKTFETDYIQPINDLKQKEITGSLSVAGARIYPFMTPYLVSAVPLAVNLVVKPTLALRNGFKAPVTEFAKQFRQCSGERIVRDSILYGTTLFATELIANHSEQLGDFDPSGHVITKLAAGTLLGTALDYVRGTADKTTALVTALLAGGIIATDAVMMYNTAGNCHTLSEVVAGLALATLVIHPIASLSASGYSSFTTGTANKISSFFGAPQLKEEQKAQGEKEKDKGAQKGKAKITGKK